MQTQTFRKRPVEIQAVQWSSPKVAYQLVEWSDHVVAYEPNGAGPTDPQTGECWGRLTVETLEGQMLVAPRDWLIRGVQGEFYPIKDGIFRETYEAVE